MVLKTSEMKIENRARRNTPCVKHYDTCEYCGTFHDGSEFLNLSRYYHKYRMILCDRCVDNFDVFNNETDGSYWPVKLSQSRNMKPFIKDAHRIPKIVSFD
jgi:ribosomal protein S14